MTGKSPIGSKASPTAKTDAYVRGLIQEDSFYGKFIKNRLFSYKTFITELIVMRMTRRIPLVLVTLMGFSLWAAEKPNVLLIVCDDLNDYVETLGGHPQTQTPHLRKLIESGVSFTQAHCNIPICKTSFCIH